MELFYLIKLSVNLNYTSKRVTDPKPNTKVRGAYRVLVGRPEGKRPCGITREITTALLFFYK
jgi:hypothetical protein